MEKFFKKKKRKKTTLQKNWLQKEIHCFFFQKERKKVKLLSRVLLFGIPWTAAYQVPPSMGFSRQEYWSGLPFPSPGDLPDPGIEPGSPTLQADTLPSEPLCWGLFFKKYYEKEIFSYHRGKNKSKTTVRKCLGFNLNIRRIREKKMNDFE